MSTTRQHGERSRRCPSDAVGAAGGRTTKGDDDAQHGEHDLLASVNYAMRFQESATSLMPRQAVPGVLALWAEGVLVQAIKAEEATALATRYAPERYQEFRLP